MKRTAITVFMSFALVLLVGCSTTKITISAEPDDAKIYLDGEYVGDGTVNYDTKQVGQWGGSKELSVVIKHPDYKTLNATIENKWDSVYGVSIGNLGLGFAGILTVEGRNSTVPAAQSIYYGGAILEVGPGAYGVLNSYKFNKSYHFVLTKKEDDSGQ